MFNLSQADKNALLLYALEKRARTILRIGALELENDQETNDQELKVLYFDKRYWTSIIDELTYRKPVLNVGVWTKTKITEAQHALVWGK